MRARALACKHALRASLGALFAVAAASCDAPQVLEDGLTACSNDIDDDGDGKIDCDDPDCAPAETCETSAVTCANDRDDDGDGKIDCEQESCRAAGFCEASALDCTLSPQSGCPRGMGCYDTSVGAGKPQCALAGVRVEREPCGFAPPNQVSGGCAPGYACDGVCYRYCEYDEDCPRGSLCSKDSYSGPGAGICTLLCLPGYPCPLRSMQCISLSRGGLHFFGKGYTLACSTIANIRDGTLRPGDPCPYPSSLDMPPNQICEPTSLCVPEPGGAFCRALCVAPESGHERECLGGHCVPVDPFDTRPALPAEHFLEGVCLP